MNYEYIFQINNFNNDIMPIVPMLNIIPDAPIFDADPIPMINPDVPIDYDEMPGLAPIEDDEMPGLVPVNNNVQIVINQMDALPVVHRNNMILTINHLLDELDDYIERNNIKNLMMAHINYILYVLRNDDGIEYTNEEINNFLIPFNIANQYEYNDNEKNLIEDFKDIVNQSNADQNKLIYNIFSGLNY
jgi:hypothetical protein